MITQDHPMENKEKQSKEKSHDITEKAEELAGIIRKKLPDLKVSKNEIVSLLKGEEIDSSLDSGQNESGEKAVPSGSALWKKGKFLANRITHLSSTIAKIATILPIVALIFQTFFLGVKTEKLQDQGLELVQSGQLMQNEISSLGAQTLTFKEDLEKQLSSLQTKVEPPTIEAEKKERRNRKKMINSVKKRIREQLSNPSNSLRELSDELKASIINFTLYCKPYQLLFDNLSPERGYMLYFLYKEKIAPNDFLEICNKGDFQYADCNGKKFVQANFSNIDLQYSSFEDGALASCNLQGVKLNNANLQGCSFWNSDLQGAEINTAVLEKAKFRNAQLKNLKLKETDISGIEFNKDADFAGVELNGAYSFDFVWMKEFLELTQLDSIYVLKSELAENARYFERLRIHQK